MKSIENITVGSDVWELVDDASGVMQYQVLRNGKEMFRDDGTGVWLSPYDGLPIQGSSSGMKERFLFYVAWHYGQKSALQCVIYGVDSPRVCRELIPDTQGKTLFSFVMDRVREAKVSDHSHRNEQGDSIPCSKPKTECDDWHQATWERMREYEA